MSPSTITISGTTNPSSLLRPRRQKIGGSVFAQDDPGAVKCTMSVSYRKNPFSTQYSCRSDHSPDIAVASIEWRVTLVQNVIYDIVGLTASNQKLVHYQFNQSLELNSELISDQVCLG